MQISVCLQFPKYGLFFMRHVVTANKFGKGVLWKWLQTLSKALKEFAKKVLKMNEIGIRLKKFFASRLNQEEKFLRNSHVGAALNFRYRLNLFIHYLDPFLWEFAFKSPLKYSLLRGVCYWNIPCLNFCSLVHFRSIFHFYTPWKRQSTRGPGHDMD